MVPMTSSPSAHNGSPAPRASCPWRARYAGVRPIACREQTNQSGAGVTTSPFPDLADVWVRALAARARVLMVGRVLAAGPLS